MRILNKCTNLACMNEYIWKNPLGEKPQRDAASAESSLGSESLCYYNDSRLHSIEPGAGIINRRYIHKGTVMDYTERLTLSYYKTIAVLNEAHQVFLVQHRQTDQICVKKVLSIYNPEIFRFLREHPIPGTPGILALWEEDRHAHRAGGIYLRHYAGRAHEKRSAHSGGSSLIFFGALRYR